MASKRKPATRYHHGDLRSALVATAWSMVSKKGVESLSLRALADALGVSHAAPAHHFPDKEALIDALRAEAWRRFAEALEAVEARGLREAGRTYVTFAVEHRPQMALMFRAGPHPTAEVGAEATRAWAALSRAVAKTIGPKRAAQEKELQAMSAAAWAGVHGLAALQTELPLPEGLSGAALTERVLDVVIAGISASDRAF